MALRHPWIGYGYSAFWLGADGQSTVMWHLMGWHPSHSHNGFLQLWLDLGLIGLAIFLIGFCVVTVRAIGLSRRSHSVESFWPLMFLAFLFLYNFTESSFLTRNSIFWILYTASILVVSPGFRPMQNSLRTAT
jgi:exopolysaccharide production protein ExoQ